MQGKFYLASALRTPIYWKRKLCAEIINGATESLTTTLELRIANPRIQGWLALLLSSLYTMRLSIRGRIC